MGAFWEKKSNISGSSKNGNFGWDIVLSNNGSRVAISDPDYDTNDLSNTGYVAVYDLSSNSLSSYELNVEITGQGANHHSGLSLSFSDDGNLLAIGSPGDEDFSGAVSIYEYSDDTWDLKGSTINGGVNNKSFGSSISLADNGSIIAIGDPEYDFSGSKVGSTHSYQFDSASNDWVQIGQNIIGTSHNSKLGYSVDLSLDGNLLAIGSPEKGLDNKNGLVSVYKLNNQNWQKIGDDILGEALSDEAGTTLSLVSPDDIVDGSIIAIGAIKNDGEDKNNSGHVRVFKYSESNNKWTKLGSDIDGTNIGDLSSYKIDLSKDGSTVGIGSIKHDASGDDVGQVRIFNFDEQNDIWRQSGFDLLGEKSNENFGSALSFSSDSETIAISSINGGENNYGEVNFYDLTSKIYPINEISLSNETALIRYHYKLVESGTDIKVKGVNLWTLDDSGENTTFDDEYKNKSYDLVIEAKTVDTANIWNLETFDITLNLVNGIFSNWNTADLNFGSNINFAKSFSKLDQSFFNGEYSYEKEGVRVTGAVGSELMGSQRINNDYAELFRVSGLYFDENIERGTTQDGETLAIDIISNDYDTVVSNYQDTDNNSSYDNALIKSLDDLGFDSSNNSIEIDRSSEIYTYQTFADLLEHGTTLWTQREIGSGTKSFLVRNGATIQGRSWWSNIGNFETELDDIVLHDLSLEQRYSWFSLDLSGISPFDSGSLEIGTMDDFLASSSNEYLNSGNYSILSPSDNSLITTKLTHSNFSVGLMQNYAGLQLHNEFNNNLSLVSFSNASNLTSVGENTVKGFSVDGISADGNASSWDDSTSESFYIDFKVRVSGEEGESISQESFYAISGNDFKDNLKVSNNSERLSKNIITFQGDLNYDGRVSLVDLAYLNAAKIHADNNSFIASDDVDANFDGEITIADIAIIESDFMKNLHTDLNHNQDLSGNYLNWDSLEWGIPQIPDSEIAHLDVGSIDNSHTFISFDNTSFLRQQLLEDSGVLNSVPITDFTN